MSGDRSSFYFGPGIVVGWGGRAEVCLRVSLRTANYLRDTTSLEMLIN